MIPFGMGGSTGASLSPTQSLQIGQLGVQIAPQSLVQAFIQTQGSTWAGIKVRGVSGQTAPLFDLLNDSDVSVFKVLQSGAVTAGALAAASVAATGSITGSSAVVSGAGSFGSLGVSGATSLATLSTSGLASLASLAVAGAATLAALSAATVSVSGSTSLATLATSGLATLASLAVTGAANLNSLAVSGASSLASLSVSSGATVSGTATVGALNVLGSSSLAAVSATSLTLSGGLTVGGSTALAAVSASSLTLTTPLADAYVANNLTISGGTISNSPISGSTGSFTTLAASGSSTLAAVAADSLTLVTPLADAYVANALTIIAGTVDNSPVGATTPHTGAFTTLSSGGLASLASLAVAGNATVGGTLGVTGAVVLSSTLSSGPVTATGTSVFGNINVSGNLTVSGSLVATTTTTGTSMDLTDHIDVASSVATSGTFGGRFRAGDNAAGSGGYKQILFAWNGNDTYQHSIRSRHDSTTPAGNAVDFYLWKQGVDTSTTVGTHHVMTLDRAGVGVFKTNPSVALDVVGSGAFSADLSVAGNLSVGTVTSGTWNGTAIADAYVVDDLTLDSTKKIQTTLTTEQMRLRYDSTHWAAFTVSSTGGLAISLLGSSGTVTVNGILTASGGITGTAISGSTGSFTTLASSGAATLNSLGVTNNATVGGTLGVTGALTAASYNGLVVSAGTVTTGVWQGSVIADAYVTDALTISGGTVNNTVIGGVTPAAGTFTSIVGQTVALSHTAPSVALTSTAGVTSGQLRAKVNNVGVFGWVSFNADPVAGSSTTANLDDIASAGLLARVGSSSLNLYHASAGTNPRTLVLGFNYTQGNLSLTGTGAGSVSVIDGGTAVYSSLTSNTLDVNTNGGTLGTNTSSFNTHLTVLGRTAHGTAVSTSGPMLTSLWTGGVQLSLRYDATNKADFTVSSAGDLALALKNSTAALNLTGALSISGTLGVTGATTFSNTLTLTSGTTPQTSIRYDLNNRFDLSVSSTGNVTLSAITGSAGGAIILAPTGSVVTNTTAVVPQSAYTTTLGSLTKPFLQLFATEMVIQNLVTLDSQITTDGRIIVGPSNQLILDCQVADTTIYVKRNNLSNGDRIRFEYNGNFEIMAVTSSASTVSGGYSYTVTRNLDGTGSNQWTAGTTIQNQGQSGNGWVDIFSVYSSMTQGLDYIYSFTNSGSSPYETGTYGSNLATEMGGITLFSSNHAVGDAYYFGLANGTFDNLYLYLDTAANFTGGTLVWEYWNSTTSAWTSFVPTFVGNASGNLQATGSNGFEFSGSSLINWGQKTINGQFAYWVRLRWSGAPTVWTASPKQTTRRIYRQKAQYGPTTAYYTRNSSTWNDVSEMAVSGNLAGYYGYYQDTPGFAAGKYANSNSFITMDASNGFRILSRSGGIDTTRFLADPSGNLTLGATSGTNTAITPTSIALKSGTDTLLSITSSAISIFDPATPANTLTSISGGVVVLGRASAANTQITSTAVNLRNSSNTLVGITSSAITLYDPATPANALTNIAAGVITLGLSTASNVAISGSSIDLKTSSTVLASLTSSALTFYDPGTPANAALTLSAGSILVGRAAASQSNILITSGAISLRNNTTNKLVMDSSGDLTMTGNLIMSTSGVFKAGQSAYATGAGWWMEYNGGTPRMSLGNGTTEGFTWNGTTFTVAGSLSLTGVGTIGSSGGLYVGSGSFASPTTGYKLYVSSSNVYQEWWETTTRIMRFGGDGIKLLAGSSANTLYWMTSVPSGDPTAWLTSVDSGTSHNSSYVGNPTNVAGRGSQLTFRTNYSNTQSGSLVVASISSGSGVTISGGTGTFLGVGIGGSGSVPPSGYLLDVQGSVYLGTNGSGTAARYINWGGASGAGIAAPTVTTTRSVGSRLVLWDAFSNGTQADYAVGIESGSIWLGVPTTSQSIKFYGGTTRALTVQGDGALVGNGSHWYVTPAYNTLSAGSFVHVGIPSSVGNFSLMTGVRFYRGTSENYTAIAASIDSTFVGEVASFKGSLIRFEVPWLLHSGSGYYLQMTGPGDMYYSAPSTANFHIYTGSIVRWWNSGQTAHKGFQVNAGGDWVEVNTGAKLSNGGTWTNGSDLRRKTNFRGFEEWEEDAILDRIAWLPVSIWSYKVDQDIDHVGPMAQDFHAAFGGLGGDDCTISTVDADGVLFIGVKALKRQVEALRQEIVNLRWELANKR